MAITISGQNNNDKILASDGVLDQISGFNVVGVMTATTFNVTTKHTANHIDVGSSIQLGNAGIITATTLIGNVTGNVNSTSNLLFQISGSEKFRVGNGGQLGIGGANYGSSGQVLTSGGSGSAPTWSTINSDKITEGNTEAEVVDTGSDGHFKVTTEGGERIRVGPAGQIGIAGANYGSSGQVLTSGGSGASVSWSTITGTTINNNAANRIITGSGSANTLNGNTYATWNGNNFALRGGEGENCTIELASDEGDDNGDFWRMMAQASDNALAIDHYGTGSWVERLRIDSSGRVMIGNTAAGQMFGGADDLIVGTTSGARGITIISENNTVGRLLFSDSLTSGAATYQGQVNYNHSTDTLDLRTYTGGSITLSTSNTERLYIDSVGSIGQGTATPRVPDGSNVDNPLNGDGTNGNPVFTIYGDSPAINLISSTLLSGDYSLINFGRAGGTTNPYRAVIGYKQSDDILHINANNHIVFDTGGTINTGERVRITSAGDVILKRGGISATPSLEIFGSGNAGDAEADNLRIHNWGDSDGDYWKLGVNCGLNGSGNSSKPSTTLKGAAVTIDGRFGRVFLQTSPSSTSTVYDALIADSNGIIRTPRQPAFRSYTTSDNNGNGVVSGIWNTGAADKRKFDNNDDFNESNGRFTAPVDGVYQITLAWDENNTSTIVDVQINGGGGALDLYSTEPHATSGWNTHFTGSIAKLSAGDYVTVSLRQTGGTYPFHQGGGRWGHFSVYLIG